MGRKGEGGRRKERGAEPGRKGRGGGRTRGAKEGEKRARLVENGREPARTGGERKTQR